MTETARTERAKIVAWLRRADGWSDKNCAEAWALAEAADEIEAGTHLKKPEPSIPVADWIDKPSAS